MSRTVRVRGTELTAEAVEAALGALGPCTVRLEGDGGSARVTFETHEAAKRAARLYNNVRIGGAYATVELERGAGPLRSAVLPLREMFTALFVSASPVCRIKTHRDVSPSLTVLSVVGGVSVESLERKNAFCIHGATKEDALALHRYLEPVHAMRQCVLMTQEKGRGIVYVFPAAPELEHRWGLRPGAAAIGVTL